MGSSSQENTPGQVLDLIPLITFTLIPDRFEKELEHFPEASMKNR